MDKINNIFSIYNDNEYVEIKNNNPISNFHLKKILVSLNKSWKIFNQEIKIDIKNSSYFFQNISNWQNKLETFLEINNSFPSIDNLMSLLISSNINQYIILPYQNAAAKDLLKFNGFPKQNLLLKMQDGVQTFRLRNVKRNTQKIKPNREFKIIRIIKNDKNDFVKHGAFIFIDLKVRKLNITDVLNTVLTLPEFWRNFHFISRKPIKQQNKVNSIYQTNNYFTSLYNPSSEYKAEQSVILKNNEIIQNMILNNMEISISSLAAQLIFMQPGHILPMTENEQNYSAEEAPDYIIKLEKDDKQTHLISINVPASMITDYFNNFSNNFEKREQLFASHFDMINYSGGRYIATLNNQIIFNYENNMVCLFESLTKFDNYQLN